jgi:GntR family transcriptional regulator/MocR family aminotransferase
VSELEFRVLGTMEVWRRTEPVVIGRGSTVNLLAGLLVSANTVVSSGRLAEIAWGDGQPQHPRAALCNKVSRLRRILGEETVTTVGDGYLLQLDPGQLDLQRFDDRILAARGTPDAETAGVLEEAISLWRGTPLSNTDCPFLQEEIVSPLVERYLTACETWAAATLRLERPNQVVARIGPLVAAHPFRESLTRQLMLALHQAGRSAEALKAYAALRGALRDELGTDPSAPLQDLCTTILRGTVPETKLAPATSSRERPRWAVRGPRPARLIGRDGDQRSLAEAVRGYPAVTVVGAPGVGKTELALTTAQGLWTQFPDGVAVAELGTIPAQDGDVAPALSRLILSAVGCPADSAHPSPEAVLLGLHPRGVLLVLDNAEHIRAACARMVDLITRSCPKTRIITTSRRPLGFSGERVVTVAPLEPGPAADLLRLRAAELGSEDLAADPEGLARLSGLLDGLPLAVELAAARLRTTPLRTLIRQLTIRQDILTINGRPGLAHQHGLPDTLDWSYQMLDKPSRTLLTRLAAFDGPFRTEDAERACSALPLREPDIAALLSDLADNSLVHTTGSGSGRSYRLLGPIREFAVGQELDDAGAAGSAFDRLAAFAGKRGGQDAGISLCTVEVHISLVGRRDLTGEIYRQLRAAITTGKLRAGEALPSTRELASRLSVSRGTVATAYDRLGGEGFVTSQVGAGTFVSEGAVRSEPEGGTADGKLRPKPVWEDIPVASAVYPPARYEFRSGLPDLSRFPFQVWRRLMAHSLRASALGPAGYGNPLGEEALKAAIARHLQSSRGVTVTPEQVTITNGTQQAIHLIARVLLSQGDHVALEDPGYLPARWAFDTMGMEVTGVPVDDHGLVVDALPASARLVYVTPSHQYPLGPVMSLPRRGALLDWADRHDAAIIEDDYDSEFRYGGRPIEPLRTLDTSGRVIYAGSFSKSMLPALRVGFIAAPPALSRALQTAKFITDWHTALPTQLALARFIDEGHLARHIHKMRGIYEERHNLISEVITTGPLSRHLTLIPSAAGLHISAIARRASAEELSAVTRRALTADVAVQPLSGFPVTPTSRAGLIIGYGAIEANDIREGLSLLGRAFDDGSAPATW